MARQDINIGIEGNDGTGDSIRASFKKVNENFVEMYAVFGLGGQINFTTLSDTPDVLTPQSMPIVNSAGTKLMLAELDTSSDNSIMMEVIDGVGDTPGTLKLISKFGRVADDVTPRIGGPLYAANNAIAGVDVSQESVDYLNAVHDTELSLDQLVITKGYADLRYLTTDVPIKLDEEALGKGHFRWDIFDYISGTGQFYSSLKITSHTNKDQQEVVTGHGLDSAWNGTAVKMDFILAVPAAFSNYRTENYYIRIINDEHIWLYEERYKEFSITSNIDDAKTYALDVTAATINVGDVHSMTIASYDESLEGNYLGDEVVPRKDLVYRHGDSMTGPLYMPDHPGDLRGAGAPNGPEDLQVATKLYVDQGASWSSPHVLYVSESGDDSMGGVPAGREGSAIAYSYRTINAAAAKAEELIKTSPIGPGPYKQRLTFADGTERVDTHVMNTRIKDGIENGGFNENVRTLLGRNKAFILAETYDYIGTWYPEFTEDEASFKDDLEALLDAVIMDMNQGSTSNYLSIRAAQRYYSSTDKRRILQFFNQQLNEVLDFANALSQQILLQDFTHQGMLAQLTTGSITTLTLELPNANYTTSSQIRIEDIDSTHDLATMNGETFFLKAVENDIRQFELYLDANLLQPHDTTGMATYDNNAGAFPSKTGIIYQASEFQIMDSTMSSVEPSRLMAVEHKWDVIKDIVNNGIDSAPEISYGNVYQLITKNNNVGHLVQTELSSIDARAGKVVIGVYSKAIGEIVRFTNNVASDQMADPLDPTHIEIAPTIFDLHLLTPHHFEVGEPIEFANTVQEKEIAIKIESGTYEEDFPIRLTRNVSLIGDDYRRVIIKPKSEEGSYLSRTSQSKWANIYFCRDNKFDGLDIVRPGMKDFINQDGIVQGSFGHHYLHDPSKNVNVGPTVVIPANNINASNIIESNINFLLNEVVFQLVTAHPTLVMDEDAILAEIRRIAESLVYDYRYGGVEKTLEMQGYYYDNSRKAFDDDTYTLEYITKLHTLIGELLVDTTVTVTNGSEEPNILKNNDNERLVGEDDSLTMLSGMLDIIRFAFDSDFNPPRRNVDMDIFMLDDATTISNVTCRGHGGFMCVFDPEGQILTRSPYVHSSASYSRSINRKTFSGGMYLDAYAGNTPLTITKVYNETEDAALIEYEPGTWGSLRLRVQSPAEQGLYIRPPALPAPFYLEGRRYQINAISDYDKALGVGTVHLDNSSNNNYGYVVSQFSDYNPANITVSGSTYEVSRDIFLQTAGNRSAMANEFTQINDLGYGIVASNGSYTEQESIVTYYCQSAFYANNGSEIRSLNSSNGFGNFGLVAEGADPNEIPNQVKLKYRMAEPAKAKQSGPGDNTESDSSIFISGLARPPHPNCILTINHGGVVNSEGVTVNRLNYGVSSVTLAQAGSSQLENIYRFAIKANESIDTDFYQAIQATIADDTPCEYRDSAQYTITGIRAQEALRTRPSTSINFDESDNITYRTLDFQFQDIDGNDLASDETRLTVDEEFKFVELVPDFSNFLNSYGASGGDQRLAITALTSGTDFSDAERVVGTEFVWNGRLFKVTEYHNVYKFSTDQATGFGVDTALTSGANTAKAVKDKTGFETYVYDVVGTFTSGDTVNGQSVTSNLEPAEWAFIKFEYVTGSDILGNTGVGITAPIDADVFALYGALAVDTTAEVTIGISILRATGHDFTKIGTGSFNDTNYPTVLYGEPKNPLAGYYTDTPGASSSEVWEKRKGRVFWVSTDQYGLFRVGRYFNVDQGTGAITFSGKVGISNAVSLGFTKGVTVDEFSPDDTFVDLSSTAIPTEKAIAGYISRVLGYDFNLLSSYGASTGRIGPGFLPLDGINSNASMSGALHMGSNRITDVANPVNLDDAVNKGYVDDNSAIYMEIQKLRDWGPASRTLALGSNEVIISTGARILYVNIPTTGSFNPGMAIRNTNDPNAATITGTVIHSHPYTDELFGDVIKVTYTPSLLLSGRSFDSNLDAQVFGGNYVSGPGSDLVTTFISPVGDNSAVGGSFAELTNAGSDSSSNISLTTERGTDVATLKINIKSETITNSHINSSAGITQSKLLLNKATTGASATTNPPQSSLGLAQFDEAEFISDNGFIRLKASTGTDDGIELNKLQHISAGHVLGRRTSDGEVDAVPFSAITSGAGGIVRGDFPTRFTGGTDALVRVSGVPGNADSDAFDTIGISADGSTDTIARRNGLGDLEARRFIAEDYYQYRDAANIVRDLFSAQGEGEINVGDIIGSDGLVISGPSATQNNSSYDTKFVASNWMYAKGIESANNGGNSGSGVGITFGAGTGFADEGNATILFFGDGEPVLSFNKVGTITEIVPLGTGTRNIGRSTKKFNTVYADVFDGSATRAYYADLAENYLADGEYNTGTVLVLGGDYEVTESTKKDDTRVAGVISENPAHLMNSELEGTNVAQVALQGRVPCKVIGRIVKGDIIVCSAVPGHGMVNNKPQAGSIIGKAVSEKDTDGKGIVEVLVGKA
jgi:hypothetical protein